MIMLVVTQEEAQAVYDLLEDQNINQIDAGARRFLRETRELRKEYFSDTTTTLDMSVQELQDVLNAMFNRGWAVNEDYKYGPVYERFKKLVLDSYK
jgi:hypothetical protein